MGSACGKQRQTETEDASDTRADGRINWTVVGRSEEERAVITDAVNSAIKQKMNRRSSLQLARDTTNELDRLRKAEEDGRALDLGRMVGLASKDVVQDDYSDAHGQLTDATTARQATSSAKHGRRGSFMDTAFDRNYPIHGEKIKTAGKVRLINRRQSAGCYRPVKIM